ncbi:MAG: ABC transporter substrate-binding protein [Alphaproteobacteria bacterium]
MKKYFSFFMVFVLLSACGDINNKDNASKQVVKIATTLPLTGNLAKYGIALQKSLELALEDINKKELKYDYKLIIEDDAYELKKAMTNLSKFKGVDNVNVVMTFWGNTGTLASSWAEQHKVVHISCALSDVVGKGFYNFNHTTQPKTHLNRIVKFYKDNNYKKVGFVYLKALEIQEMIDNWVPFFEKEGFEVVFIKGFNNQERDFRIEIQKMKEANPDVVELMLQTPTLNIFGRQSKELGFDVPMSGINNIPDALSEYEGDTYITEETGKADFTKHFEDSTGLKQTSCVVNFYDGFNMIVDAFEKAGDGISVPENKDVVNIMLNNKDFNSVLDKITIDEDGNIDSPSVLKRVINGKGVEVEK